MLSRVFKGETWEEYIGLSECNTNTKCTKIANFIIIELHQHLVIMVELPECDVIISNYTNAKIITKY